MKRKGGCSAWSRPHPRRPPPRCTGRHTAWSPTTSTEFKKGHKTMRMRLRTKPVAGAAGIAAVVLAAGLGLLVPAWGQQAAPAGGGMSQMAASGNQALIKDIAAARMATGKYATNLAAAQADGYQILTKMMPNMGIHYVN